MPETAGSIRRHPDWPTTPHLAIRTAFEDGQFPGWTSWLHITPTGTQFTTPDTVADWPTATLTDTTET